MSSPSSELKSRIPLQPESMELMHTENSSKATVITDHFLNLDKREDNFKECEKEYLTIETTPSKNNSKKENAMIKDIKQELESKLFIWSSFPIVFPESLLQFSNSGPLTAVDLFHFPDLREDDVAYDANGNLKRLSDSQLKAIKRTGQFTVPSINFPNQEHTWRLSLFLQQGSERGRKNLRRGLAIALKLIVIYAKGRIVGKNFSLRKTCIAWKKIPFMFLDIFFGMPGMTVIPYSSIIDQERIDFIISCLTPKDEEKLKNWGENVLRLLKYRKRDSRYPESLQIKDSHLEAEKFMKSFNDEFIAEDRDNIPISFILSSYTIWENVEATMNEILTAERNDSDWFINFREKVIEDLKGSGIPDLEIEAEAIRLVEKEFKQRIVEKVLQNESLKLQVENEKIPQILVDQINSIFTVEECERIYCKEEKEYMNTFENTLRSKYPIRSLIKRWMRRQLRDEEEKHTDRNKWKLPEEVLKKTEAESLLQTNYFVGKLLDFEQKRRDDLENDLSQMKEPLRIFYWKRKIWNPKNYTVTKVQKSTGEKIEVPVTISIEPYSRSAESYSYDREYSFTLEKKVITETTTQYPFWRWNNFFHRYITWMMNGLYLLLITIPWSSPLSFRALFSWSHFYPSYTVDQSNGDVRPNASSKRHSYLSRLRALGKHIRKSRNKFEATPDRGFLGKSVTRPLNLFWNYFIKGFVGGIILTLMFPIACLFISTCSFAIGLLCPLWMFFVVLGFHLVCLFIFDKDTPRRNNKNRIALFFDLILYRFLILGLIQPISAFITAVILCPLGSILVLLLAYVRFGIRSFWDTMTFQILIKRFGRVPATDSWVARRIGGPGLSGQYFYQIKPFQALVQLQYQLELEELKEYEKEAKRKITEPLELYKESIKTLFGSFGGSVDQTHELYKKIKRNVDGIERNLISQQIPKHTALNKKLNIPNISRVRMNEKDLATCMPIATFFTKSVFSKRIIPRMPPDEQQKFWKNKDLVNDDWKGLTIKLFETVFSREFPIPLEEGETRFKLNVEHIDSGSYMDQLLSGEHREDLDLVYITQDAAPNKYTSIKLPEWKYDRFTKRTNLSNRKLPSIDTYIAQMVDLIFWQRQLPRILASAYNRLTFDGKLGENAEEIPLYGFV